MNASIVARRGLRAAAAALSMALAACGLAGAADRTFDVPPPTADQPLAKAKGSQTLVLAGGCFWGVDAVFKHVKGVKNNNWGRARRVAKVQPKGMTQPTSRTRGPSRELRGRARRDAPPR